MIAYLAGWSWPRTEREGERVTNWLTKTWAGISIRWSWTVRGSRARDGSGTLVSVAGAAPMQAWSMVVLVGLRYVPKCCWMKLVFVGSGGTRRHRAAPQRARQGRSSIILGSVGRGRAALYQRQPGEMVRAAAISKQRGAKFRRPVESSSSAFC